MVVRLRLQRFGRTHSPFYRMVAANAKAPRDGKFLEIVGTYNPIANKKTGVKEIRLKTDRLKYWLSVGAQPSEMVSKLIRRARSQAGAIDAAPAEAAAADAS